MTAFLVTLIAFQSFKMPYTPDQFIQSNVVEQIEPEIIAFVSALGGIAAFKLLVYRR